MLTVRSVKSKQVDAASQCLFQQGLAKGVWNSAPPHWMQPYDSLPVGCRCRAPPRPSHPRSPGPRRPRPPPRRLEPPPHLELRLVEAGEGLARRNGLELGGHDGVRVARLVCAIARRKVRQGTNKASRVGAVPCNTGPLIPDTRLQDPNTFPPCPSFPLLPLNPPAAPTPAPIRETPNHGPGPAAPSHP